MIEKQMGNQVKTLLESVDNIRRGFHHLSIEEQREYLLFLSRIIKLMKHKPTDRKVVLKFKQELESEMMNGLGVWLEAEMKSEAVS